MAIQKFQGRFTVFWIMSRLFSSNWKTWGMTDLKQESFIVGGRIPIGFSTKSGDRRLHTCSRDFVQRAEQEAAINATSPSRNSLTLMRCAFFGMPFGTILVSPHWGWWHCEAGSSTLAWGVHHALRYSHNVTKHIADYPFDFDARLAKYQSHYMLRETTWPRRKENLALVWLSRFLLWLMD